MVRRLANSRNVPKSDSSLSIPDRSNAVNNAMLSFNAPESQGLRALFAGFIDLYCETIPELRRTHLKNELRSLLIGLGVVPEVFFSNDLGPVRLVCSQLLSKLVRSVLMGTEPPDNRNIPFLGRPTDIFNQSRFRTEFEEIETIGRGGFGQVYRVRSLLDKHEYAIKKIVARDDAEQLSQRILHEVQILAGLQHVNIVRYHCGWIEVESVQSASSSSPTFTPHRPPPRERKDSPRIAIQEIFDSDSDKDTSAQVKEIGKDEEHSLATVSSVSSSAVVQKQSPVGGRFWNNAETSSESIEDASKTSVAIGGEDTRNGESSITSMSSMGSAVARKSPGGRFWTAETSGDCTEDESTDKQQHSPALATAIPLEVKIGGGDKGDGQWMGDRDEEVMEENGIRGGRKEVAVMQLKVRMVIFIQMELCTSTLEKYLWKRNEQLIRQSSPVDGSECLSLFRQLISAVEYIHEKGLIHRDIKPGNLFLKMDRLSSINLLLGDFGLSCIDGDDTVEAGKDGGDSMVVASNAHSIGVGTTTYAAPEQMRTSRYGREVDLFSAGIVLAELFSVVGTGSERLAVIERLREQRELPHTLTTNWPTISSLVLRLTSDRPEERPTATALLHELNEESSEIRSLREMVSNQKTEIVALRKEVKKLRLALNNRKNEKKKKSSDSHSSM